MSLPPLLPFLRLWWDDANPEAADNPSPLEPPYPLEEMAPFFAFRSAFLDWVQDSPGFERAQDEITARHARPRPTLASWESPDQNYADALDPATADLPPWARFWQNPQALLAAGGATRRDVMRLPVIGPSWRFTGDLLADTLTYAGAQMVSWRLVVGDLMV